jgi:hypothetical protein
MRSRGVAQGQPPTCDALPTATLLSWRTWRWGCAAKAQSTSCCQPLHSIEDFITSRTWVHYSFAARPQCVHALVN